LSALSVKKKFRPSFEKKGEYGGGLIQGAQKSFLQVSSSGLKWLRKKVLSNVQIFRAQNVELKAKKKLRTQQCSK